MALSKLGTQAEADVVRAPATLVLGLRVRVPSNAGAKEFVFILEDASDCISLTV
jgi:hypothetical protein